MKTTIYKNSIGDCASIIKTGGLVGGPTETVYGLAGNGLNPEAVAKIYEVKNRPEIKPLSLMVSSVEDIKKLCKDIPTYAYQFLVRNWPGPVTAIFKAKSVIPDIVLAGGKTVGLRCPDAVLTLALIKDSGVPLAAPSANPSGLPSPKTALSVYDYFNGKIDAVIDGGECTLGTESIIIDFSSHPIRLLRKGFLKLSLIGITGQTGAGKTSVLSYFQELGYGVIDCDSLYHDLLITNKSLIEDIKKEFPDAFIHEKLDRKTLAAIVFSSHEALQKLNLITHGYITCEIFNRLFEFQNNGFSRVAIDAVELISSGLGAMCDNVMGLIADPTIRTERIVNRDHISWEAATKRVNSQKPESYYIDNCNIIIENNGTRQELIEKLKKELSF